MEVHGLLARRDKITRLFEDKVAREGEAGILYDCLVERRTTPQGGLE
jgi:hypothetical protein